MPAPIVKPAGSVVDVTFTTINITTADVASWKMVMVDKDGVRTEIPSALAVVTDTSVSFRLTSAQTATAGRYTLQVWWVDAGSLERTHPDPVVLILEPVPAYSA